MKTLSFFILFLCFNVFCMDPDTAWKMQSISNSKNVSISKELVDLETIHNKRIIQETSVQYCLNLGECYNNELRQAAYDMRSGKRKPWDINTRQSLDDAKYSALSKPIFLDYQDFSDFVTLAADRKRSGNISMGEIYLANLIRPQKKEGYFIKLINKFYSTNEQEKKIYADWEFIKKFEKID